MRHSINRFEDKIEVQKLDSARRVALNIITEVHDIVIDDGDSDKRCIIVISKNGKHRDDEVVLEDVFDSRKWSEAVSWLETAKEKAVGLLKIKSPKIAFNEDFHGLFVFDGVVIPYINGHKITMREWDRYLQGEYP